MFKKEVCLKMHKFIYRKQITSMFQKSPQQSSHQHIYNSDNQFIIKSQSFYDMDEYRFGINIVFSFDEYRFGINFVLSFGVSIGYMIKSQRHILIALQLVSEELTSSNIQIQSQQTSSRFSFLDSVNI